MKYLIVQEWNSTKGNHAGMKHMCDLLCKKYPNKYRMIVKDSPENANLTIFQRIITKITNRQKYFKKYLTICESMFKQLKYEDEIYLLEYLLPIASQYELACYIKSKYPGIKIYALAHLTPTWFRSQFSSKRLMKWLKPIDKIMTLGSSLSTYLLENGVPKTIICTGFHYVDMDFYYSSLPLQQTVERPTIIAQGFLQRNFSLLADVVNRTPDVNWIICRGRKNEIDTYFKSGQNVKIYGYLEESELRNLMSIADLSINVMEDTVGSNVITTSLAMGLGIIVSDVGSIRDYCGNDNAVFCENNAESFIAQINLLKKNPNKINKMRQASLQRAKSLTIENIDKWFSLI